MYVCVCCEHRRCDDLFICENMASGRRQAAICHPGWRLELLSLFIATDAVLLAPARSRPNRDQRLLLLLPEDDEERFCANK